MLKIADLHARVEENEILKGIDLEVGAGEVHAIMGPNGSGKSTLANVIAGRDVYETTRGSVTLDGQDLLEMSPEERAHAGVFMAFQYPVEIPGVSNTYFLRAALNSVRTARGEEEIGAMSFLTHIKEKVKSLGLSDDMLSRGVNEGFSGGEKKKHEIFQMAVLEPKLCILDETDSGLDIDALQTVAAGVNAMRSPERSFVIVTHYQRMLNFIEPDFVHIMIDGRLVKSGGKGLALELEEKGYGWLEEEPANSS